MLIMRREIILMEIKCASMNLHRRRKGDTVGMCMPVCVRLCIEIARRFFLRPRKVYEPRNNAADRNLFSRR